MGLKINTEGRSSDTVTEGFVLSQYPDAGDVLYEGSTVYITYSTGPEIEMTTVPSVVGLTLSEAKLRLESYDLTYDVTEEFSDSPVNEIIFQSIEPYEEVEVHTKVSLIVSKGPEIVEPDPNEQVTPDPDTQDPTVPDENNPDSGNNGGLTGIIDRITDLFGLNAN